PPCSSPFPYTTLFRSDAQVDPLLHRVPEGAVLGVVGAPGVGDDLRAVVGGGIAVRVDDPLHRAEDALEGRAARAEDFRADELGRSEEHTSELQSRGHL